jgi:hypothetical protein
MIVIRCALVSMSMECNLDDVLMIMDLPMVEMLMQSHGKDRDTARRPQEGAHDQSSNETLSHSSRVSHSNHSSATASRRPLAMVLRRLPKETFGAPRM